MRAYQSEVRSGSSVKLGSMCAANTRWVQFSVVVRTNQSVWTRNHFSGGWTAIFRFNQSTFLSPAACALLWGNLPNFLFFGLEVYIPIMFLLQLHALSVFVVWSSVWVTAQCIERANSWRWNVLYWTPKLPFGLLKNIFSHTHSDICEFLYFFEYFEKFDGQRKVKWHCY